MCVAKSVLSHSLLGIALLLLGPRVCVGQLTEKDFENYVQAGYALAESERLGPIESQLNDLRTSKEIPWTSMGKRRAELEVIWEKYQKALTALNRRKASKSADREESQLRNQFNNDLTRLRNLAIRDLEQEFSAIKKASIAWTSPKIDLYSSPLGAIGNLGPLFKLDFRLHSIPLVNRNGTILAAMAEKTFWITGVDTTEMDDQSRPGLFRPVILESPTQYKTVLGATKTVRTIRQLSEAETQKLEQYVQMKLGKQNESIPAKNAVSIDKTGYNPAEFIKQMEGIGLAIDGMPWKKSKTFNYWIAQLRLWNDTTGYVSYGATKSGELCNEMVVQIKGKNTNEITDLFIESEIHSFSKPEQVKKTIDKAIEAMEVFRPSAPDAIKSAAKNRKNLTLENWKVVSRDGSLKILFNRDPNWEYNEN